MKQNFMKMFTYFIIIITVILLLVKRVSYAFLTTEVDLKKNAGIIITTDAIPPKVTGYSWSQVGNTISGPAIIEEGSSLVKYYGITFTKNGSPTEEKIEENNIQCSNIPFNTSFPIKIWVEDINGLRSNEWEENIVINNPTLSDYIIDNVPKVTSGTGLYYHNSSLANGAKDNNYRYAGGNPNNYINFYGQLYRIIGIFDDKVKLIQNSSTYNDKWVAEECVDKYDCSDRDSCISQYCDVNATDYQTCCSECSNSYPCKITGQTCTTPDVSWPNSNIFKHLKDEVNGYSYKDKIASVNWHYGSFDSLQNSLPKDIFDREHSSSLSTVNSKVGIINVSDFAYAADDNAWTNTLWNYDSYTADNWMDNVYEWTMSKDSSETNKGYVITTTGYATKEIISKVNNVRRVIYLNPDVLYNGGTGTSSDPYKIKED